MTGFPEGGRGLSCTSHLALPLSPRPHPQPHVSSDLGPQGLAATGPRLSVSLWAGVRGAPDPPPCTPGDHGGSSQWPSARPSGAPAQSWPRAPGRWTLSLPARPAGGPGRTRPRPASSGCCDPSGPGCAGSAGWHSAALPLGVGWDLSRSFWGAQLTPHGWHQDDTDAWPQAGTGWEVTHLPLCPHFTQALGPSHSVWPGL